MIFYRVAFQMEQLPAWKWKSSRLTSLGSVLAFLKVYGLLPKDRIRVFFASSQSALDQMLSRENHALVSNSMTADLLLSGKRRISVLEMQRLEAEFLRYEDERAQTLSLPPASVGYAISAPAVEAFSTGELATESGSGGDHDIPYRFTPADTWQEALAWIKLLAQVQRGELEP